MIHNEPGQAWIFNILFKIRSCFLPHVWSNVYTIACNLNQIDTTGHEIRSFLCKYCTLVPTSPQDQNDISQKRIHNHDQGKFPLTNTAK